MIDEIKPTDQLTVLITTGSMPKMLRIRKNDRMYLEPNIRATWMKLRAVREQVKIHYSGRNPTALIDSPAYKYRFGDLDEKQRRAAAMA